MFDVLVDLATASPWAYLAVAAVAALDALLPLVPSEAVVVSAGALAASGELELYAVVAAAAVGAIVGDNLTYALGRFLGVQLSPWISRRPRLARRRDWAERTLQARGSSVIVTARFIPGGRTATTLVAGFTQFRWTRFLRLSTLAGSTWAACGALLGYLGGATFEDRPYVGLAFGLLLSLVATTVVAAVIRRRARLGGPEIGDAADASAGVRP